MHQARARRIFLACLAMLVVTGCGKRNSSGESTGASSSSGSASSSEDENAVLASPQFTAPIMLHLGMDAYQKSQELAALNGVDPRGTNGAVYEKTDFSPCSVDKQQILDYIDPSIDAISYDRVAVTNALFTQNVYHFDTYTIRYPSATMPEYGTENTFYCAVKTEGSVQPPPGQSAQAIHGPLNVLLGQRVFKQWTYRNEYTTPMPGHGDVQMFAGTFTYAIRLTLSLGNFTSDGTGSAKVALNPDTGKREIVSLVLNDPRLVP